MREKRPAEELCTRIKSGGIGRRLKQPHVAIAPASEVRLWGSNSPPGRREVHTEVIMRCTAYSTAAVRLFARSTSYQVPGMPLENIRSIVRTGLSCARFAPAGFRVGTRWRRGTWASRSRAQYDIIANSGLWRVCSKTCGSSFK